jgi:hypothetical protein
MIARCLNIIWYLGTYIDAYLYYLLDNDGPLYKCASKYDLFDEVLGTIVPISSGYMPRLNGTLISRLSTPFFLKLAYTHHTIFNHQGIIRRDKKHTDLDQRFNRHIDII